MHPLTGKYGFPRHWCFAVRGEGAVFWPVAAAGTTRSRLGLSKV